MPAKILKPKAESRKRNRPPRWFVRECYRQLREDERAKRERTNAVRELAWALHTSRGCWSFWRTGWRNRYGAKLARGADHTIIPGYDVLAREVAGEFPEYAGDDGTERLFELLLSPYVPFPSRDALWARAEQVAEHAWRKRKAESRKRSAPTVPF